MAKNIVIGGLGVLVLLLSVRLIALENFRYATLVGFCLEPADYLTQPAELVPDIQIKRYECLKSQQTRTRPLWHVWYALVEPM